MTELDEKCPKVKIQEVGEKLDNDKDLDLSKMKEAWSETGEIFKSAIDYMANQSEMMSGVMDKSDKTSKELKLTRVVVFGICTAVVFIDVVSALFK